MLRFSVQIWILCSLYAGTFSDEDVDACEQRPCQNGGTCESHDGAFRCLCSQQSQNGRLYGGDTCAVTLSGCDDFQCDNGGICSPLLVDHQHTYSCICRAGYKGPRCRTATAFSFETNGYMSIETRLLDAEAPLSVTFSFRTGRPVGTLLQRRVDDLLLTIELLDGRLRLSSLRGRGSSTLVQELPDDVSTDKWHTVEALLGGVISLIRLLCADGGCARETGTESRQLLVQGSGDVPDAGPLRQSLFLGARAPDWDFDRADGVADPRTAFIGCFRDVLVDSQLVVPGWTAAESDTQTNVTMGCSDKNKCDDNPCQNRGRCVSQGWRSSRCECHRPYEGPQCREEYVTGRFGSEDAESFSVFSLDDRPGENMSVSMFVRTRRPSGLLLVMANSTSQYLRLWLERGRVKVQVNNFDSLTGQVSVSDGHFHLVTVKLDHEMAILYQSAQIQGSIPIRLVWARPGDLVYVGGLPDPRASSSFGSYFKGCVQDLRINSKRLQFFPVSSSVPTYGLKQLVNIGRGCSSDNACAVNPCLNGGVCYSIWDDFTCNCPPNTAGQRCENMRWCALSPCPPTALCQLVSHGFECQSNVTLGGDGAVLYYRGNGRITRSLTGVSLRLRTRQPDATLLHAEKGSSYLTVSLRASHAHMELQAGVTTDSPGLTLRSSGPISDGAWHTLELSVERETSRWMMAVDGQREEPHVSHDPAGSLDFLREEVDIFLGGRGPDAGGNLAGCLGPVEIGGISLPFHGDRQLNLPRPQEEQFVLMSVTGEPPLRHGCRGSGVCSPNPCRNRGVCIDLFDLSRCVCPAEWSGPLCQDPTDYCASNTCIHGNCTVLAEGFQCVCESGHAGARCDTEIDTCANNQCSAGATCLRGVRDYACFCPRNTTGRYCNEKIPDVPWYIDMNPIPQLPVSACPGTRWNYSCFNGGTCSDGENACTCLPGFVGQWCETDVDECASEPCMNGGFCINSLNRSECACEINYSGIHCQIDINDFYVYVFLALWQNMFQLVSYLVLRLDDDPEIDWGFEIEDEDPM